MRYKIVQNILEVDCENFDPMAHPYEPKKKTMFIKRLHMKNWGPYRDQTISFACNSPKSITVVVAKNGRGKTFLFNALAMALFNYKKQIKE